MNNIVHVKSLHNEQFRHIDWAIHNVCNFDCSYCFPGLKSGTERWLTIEQYKNIVDKFVKVFDNQPFMVTFTAGEPTLFPKFPELLEYIKEKNGVNALVSNGSRTIRYWKELFDKNLLSFFWPSLHTETVTADVQHYVDILNLCHDKPVDTAIEILHTKDTIKRAIKWHKILVENTGSLVNMRSMYNMTYSGYDQEDLDYVSKNTYVSGKYFNEKHRVLLPHNLNFPSRVIVTTSAGEKRIAKPTDIIKNNQINFYGWECYPSTIFRVKYDRIYSSTCIKTPMIGSVFDDEYKIPTGFNICPSTECNCVWDHYLEKKRPNDTNRVIPIIPKG